MTIQIPLRALAVACVLALSACATTAPAPETSETTPAAAPAPKASDTAAAATDGAPAAPAAFPEDVEGRARVRWELLIAKDAGRAYDLLSPGARSQMTREQYAAAFTQRPVEWVSAKPTGKKCDADTCTVTVEVRYKAEIPQSSAGEIESTAILQERWIRTGGEWLLVPQKALGGELR